MDGSEKYIEMSRKAKQLREKWVPQKGDLTFSPRDGVAYLDDLIIGLAEMTPFGANGTRIRADHIPLWRQDQLWDMVDHSMYQEPLGIMFCFLRFWYDHGVNLEYWENADFDSREQLLLAFVMHEKYNKKWSGTDWI